MTTSFDPLSNKKKIEFWQNVKGKIHAALLTCTVPTTDCMVNEIQEYLDYNELGLAWDTLCHGIIQSGVIPEKKIQVLILEIGSDMGCDQQDSYHHNIWKEITAFFD